MSALDKLHYIYDPLCGWCYAAEPMMEFASRATDIFEIQLHGGGLFDCEDLPAPKRQYIRSADVRIAEITGQEFGVPYLDKLLGSEDVRYDSSTAIAAVLAAEKVESACGVRMLKALQNAHYRQGANLTEKTAIEDVAASIGLDADRFLVLYRAECGETTQKHISATRTLMQKVGATGFPTFLFESAGKLVKLPHETFYKDPEGFVDAISRVSSSMA